MKGLFLIRELESRTYLMLFPSDQVFPPDAIRAHTKFMALKMPFIS